MGIFTLLFFFFFFDFQALREMSSTEGEAGCWDKCIRTMCKCERQPTTSGSALRANAVRCSQHKQHNGCVSSKFFFYVCIYRCWENVRFVSIMCMSEFILKNALNESCAELNFVQKIQWKHISLSSTGVGLVGSKYLLFQWLIFSMFHCVFFFFDVILLR